MSEETYLYAYDVIEVQKTGDQEIHTPLLYYQTNVVPPVIDSMFNPGEFSKDGFQDYKVLNVVLTPRSTDDENVSDTAHVTLYVQKATA